MSRSSYRPDNNSRKSQLRMAGAFLFFGALFLISLNDLNKLLMVGANPFSITDGCVGSDSCSSFSPVTGLLFFSLLIILLLGVVYPKINKKVRTIFYILGPLTIISWLIDLIYNFGLDGAILIIMALGFIPGLAFAYDLFFRKKKGGVDKTND